MNTSNAISIIIPTLNEEQYITNTIDNLFSRKCVNSSLEVIVIDAGSTDNTLKLATETPGIKVYQKREFRGKKFKSLNFGAKQSSYDILLFLDADSHVPKGFDKHILQALEKGYVGGGFMLKHDKANLSLRFIETVNTIRYTFSKWFFGDQGVFCTRKAFETVKGYPERDIMESAFFCRNLKHIGKLKLVQQHITSSSRRFYKHGVWRTFWFDFMIWTKCISGFSTVKESEKYWNG